MHLHRYAICAVRGQLAGIGSFLFTSWFWVLNSGPQVYEHVYFTYWAISLTQFLSCQCYYVLFVSRNASDSNMLTLYPTLWQISCLLIYLFVCMCTYLHKLMCTILMQMTMKTRRGCQIPWNCSNRQLWACVWVLGIEPTKSASDLNTWAISLGHGSGSLCEIFRIFFI